MLCVVAKRRAHHTPPPVSRHSEAMTAQRLGYETQGFSECVSVRQDETAQKNPQFLR